MNRWKRHKLLKLFLGGVFCIFNIGIPVMSSACPMMKSCHRPASCCMVAANPHSVNLRSETTGSCCTQKVSLQRNTNEFLQTTFSPRSEEKSTVNLIHHFSGEWVRFAAEDYQTSFSAFLRCCPPLKSHNDIPVLFSSLLI